MLFACALGLGSAQCAFAASALSDEPAGRARLEPTGADPGAERFAPRVTAAWGNDQFYSGTGDDVGFTQDASFEAHLVSSSEDFALAVRHRMIIERYGPNRTDEFSWKLSWLSERRQGPFIWTFGPSARLVLTGDYLGGRVQNAWHEHLGNGFTFENGLPNRYAPYHTGLVVGGRAGPSWLPLPWLRLLVGTELLAALGGTGRSVVALYDSFEVESAPDGVRLAFAFGVDLERCWTRDPALELPGGYDTSALYRSERARVALRGDSWELGLQSETNVGGSGANLGTLYVLLGAGSSFRHQHALRY